MSDKSEEIRLIADANTKAQILDAIIKSNTIVDDDFLFRLVSDVICNYLNNKISDEYAGVIYKIHQFLHNYDVDVINVNVPLLNLYNFGKLPNKLKKICVIDLEKIHFTGKTDIEFIEFLLGTKNIRYNMAHENYLNIFKYLFEREQTVTVDGHEWTAIDFLDKGNLDWYLHYLNSKIEEIEDNSFISDIFEFVRRCLEISKKSKSQDELVNFISNILGLYLSGGDFVTEVKLYGLSSPCTEKYCKVLASVIKEDIKPAINSLWSSHPDKNKYKNACESNYIANLVEKYKKYDVNVGVDYNNKKRDLDKCITNMEKIFTCVIYGKYNNDWKKILIGKIIKNLQTWIAGFKPLDLDMMTALAHDSYESFGLRCLYRYIFTDVINYKNKGIIYLRDYHILYFNHMIKNIYSLITVTLDVGVDIGYYILLSKFGMKLIYDSQSFILIPIMGICYYPAPLYHAVWNLSRIKVYFTSWELLLIHGVIAERMRLLVEKSPLLKSKNNKVAHAFYKKVARYLF
jgi:hypothetical protein